MANILVLGATGFIGGQIARAALQKGWQVSGFRRRPHAAGILTKADIRWFEGDLQNLPSLLNAMQDIEILFHAAGFYPPDNDPAKIDTYLKQAQLEIENVLEAARQSGVQKIVYTSSLSTIGIPEQGSDRLADERDHYQMGDLPDNGYYEPKKLMENLMLEAHQGGQEIVILNPTTVFGPGDIHVTTGQLILMAAKGNLWAVPRGVINIIDVRDAAAAHMTAAEIGQSGERYILGGENYPISKAFEIICRTADASPPHLVIPDWLLRLYTEAADNIPFIPPAPFHLKARKYWQGYNTRKAVQELKLTNRSLEETVQDSLQWFHNQGLI